MVGRIDVYWRDLAYISNDFNIQGSNDGTTWVDVISNASTSAAGLQQIPVSGTYRYWRVFCNVGVNATYVVLSEMEAYAPGVGSTKISALNNPDVQVVDDDPDTTITNNLTQDLAFTINYLV